MTAPGFLYSFNDEWPELAWVAEVSSGNSVIGVELGRRVEFRPEWFCEATWDAEFEGGDFDLTDIVAGSGCRLRDGSVTFVATGSILDRLNYLQLDDRIVISNSLSALVAHTGAVIDVTYPFYQQDLGTICNGLENIHDRICTDRGDIRLVYFDNLAIDDGQARCIPKPLPVRDFSDYPAYRSFMQDTMNAVVNNAKSDARKYPLEPIVPLSNGYDSPAVAVLAKAAGATDAFTIGIDRDGNDDSGLPIGEYLDYDVKVIKRDDWRQNDSPEVDCIAGSGAAGEVALDGLREELSGRLMLTGLFGGKAWDTWEGHALPEETFPGHDGSGLCLTELRLTRGYIHCAVPFWGGLQLADLMEISRSDSMKPWAVSGMYDRPIARRIVEEAGLPRGTFGTNKKGSSDHLLSIRNFLPDKTMIEYREWTIQNASKWLRKGRIPPLPVLGRLFDGMLTYLVLPVIHRLLIPSVRRIANATSSDAIKGFLDRLRKTARYLDHTPLFARRYTFPWALERSAKKYLRQSA